MLHTNQAELNQLYDTYCRVWAAGGQASLTTSSLAGMVTAKLEVQLGQPTDARPGAPPPHLLLLLPPLQQPQHLELLDAHATVGLLPRLRLEPGLQHTRL